MRDDVDRRHPGAAPGAPGMTDLRLRLRWHGRALSYTRRAPLVPRFGASDSAVLSSHSLKSRTAGPHRHLSPGVEESSLASRSRACVEPCRRGLTSRLLWASSL